MNARFSSLKWIFLLIVVCSIPVALWISMKFPIYPFFMRAPVAGPARELRSIFRYEFKPPLGLREWDEKLFKGKTLYEIVPDGEGGTMLRAQSTNSASAIFKKVDVPLAMRPVIRWDWRRARFPRRKEGAQLNRSEGNDFAGRVYVIFKARSIMSSDIIEYLWDETIPKGTFLSSPISDRIKMFVIRTGPGPETGWTSESRDIIQDYKLLYGKKPEKGIAAIAIMSDSDDTGSETEIFFKKIEIDTPQENLGETS